MSQPQEIQNESDYSDENLPPEVRQKLHDMQERINQLENELKETRPKKPWKPVFTKNHAYFLAVLVLAILPPALVVGDRWLNIINPAMLYDIWCKNRVLCNSAVPSYFLIIVLCMILLPFVIYQLRNLSIAVDEHAIQPLETRRVGVNQAKAGTIYKIIAAIAFIFIAGNCLYTQTIPGWELVYVWLCLITGYLFDTFSIESLKENWRNKGAFWLAVLFFHFSLIGLLAGIYGKPDLLWSMVFMAILATINLWRFRRDVPPIFWIMNLAMIGFCLELNDWWTVAQGDEYVFHTQAWNMANLMSYQELGKYVFSSTGVGGRYPYFPSIIQTVFMKFLGTEGFGWRFSNVYLCTLSVGLFYYFCRTFLSKKISLITAFLFASSSCIMSFSKIGYDNLQALFAMTLVLAVTTWALRSGWQLAYVCLGTAIALCFYVYPAALFVVPLPFILLFLYGRPLKKDTIKKWALMVLVWVAFLFPLIIQPGYWVGKVAGTFFNQPKLLETSGSLFSHFAWNLFYSLFEFLYVFAESHFITSSYVDPLTGACLLVGLPVLVFQARKQRFPWFILFAFFYFVLTIGATHDRNSPPHTRMFMLLPIYVLIAGWGITWLWGVVINIFSDNHRSGVIAAAILAIALFGVNLYQAYPLSHVRFVHTEMIEALFIRLSEKVYAAEPGTNKTYAIIMDPSWGLDGFLMLQRVYPHLAWAQFRAVQITEPVLPEESKALLKERNTIVILKPWMQEEWVRQLDGQIRALDKEPCDVLTYNGTKRTTLYHAKDLPYACAP